MSQDETNPRSPQGPSPRQENPQALWSLILGFISVPITLVCFLGPVFGVAAIILGWRSRNGIRGHWLAVFGMALGGISVVTTAVILVLLGFGVVHAPRA
jgi:hypothetical protein